MVSPDVWTLSWSRAPELGACTCSGCVSTLLELLLPTGFRFTRNADDASIWIRNALVRRRLKQSAASQYGLNHPKSGLESTISEESSHEDWNFVEGLSELSAIVHVTKCGRHVRTLHHSHGPHLASSTCTIRKYTTQRRPRSLHSSTDSYLLWYSVCINFP